ncbi:MAG: hydroxyisourate hydrolase [Beijerinckiaceae bacterium]
MSEAHGFLTTHVLDTAQGVPAAGVEIELYHIDGGNRARIASARTNADGRTDAPLLPRGKMTPGVYELVFHIGDYFSAQSITGAGRFLDVIPIRFCIDDAAAHYHVPLLASPFSYSTYRGS